MLIGTLPRPELRRRLREEGIHLVTGAFTVHLRFVVPPLLDDFIDMYAQHAVEEGPCIDDLRIRVGSQSPAPWRRKVSTWVDDARFMGPVAADLAYPALESTLNWGIATSEVTPLLLHGAVVERDGGAVLLPAPSGSGKSTLCAAMACRGWRLFSDEMALFALHGGDVLPNPRPVSLKNASIDLIRTFAPEAHLSRTFRGTPKGDIAYLRPGRDAIASSATSAPVRLIVRPTFVPRAATTTRALTRAEAFRLLCENAVNYASMLQIGFDVLTGVVERSGCYELTYSDLDDAIATIAGLHRQHAHF